MTLIYAKIEIEKKMTVTRFELARETHHGVDEPKRDAVTTWLHCR